MTKKFDRIAVTAMLLAVLLAIGSAGALAQVRGELPLPVCLSCAEFGLTWMWSPPPFSVPIPIIYCIRQAEVTCPND